MDNTSKLSASHAIVDTIMETAMSLQDTHNQQIIFETLDQAIALNLASERHVRQCTIAIRCGQLSGHSIIKLIQTRWTLQRKGIPVNFWTDTETVYCQFASSDQKAAFLSFIQVDDDGWLVG